MGWQRGWGIAPSHVGRRFLRGLLTQFRAWPDRVVVMPPGGEYEPGMGPKSEQHLVDLNALPRLRDVLRRLEEVELLADDAAIYVEADAINSTIKDLHAQQAAVQPR